MWKNINKERQECSDYSVMRLDGDGMLALRALFPTADADSLNFVLFSTSGVHGTYQTIESLENFICGNDPDGFGELTFLIIHPRLVSMRYGVCKPKNMDDISYLKKLRNSSINAMSLIGLD